MSGDRSATIKLGDRYEVDVDQNGATWTLKDLCDGSTTRIWGDPHVDQGADGSSEWDFKTTSTFVLEDGTKITCSTVDVNGQAVDAPTNGVSISNRLTITNGDNAIVVDNIGGGLKSLNGWGNIADANLSVTQSHDGQAVDAALDDGTVFNAGDGNTWLAGSTVVTSDLFNADGTLKGFDADAQTAAALAASTTASLSDATETEATDQTDTVDTVVADETVNADATVAADETVTADETVAADETAVADAADATVPEAANDDTATDAVAA